MRMAGGSYESPDNVTIRDLRVSGDSLFFLMNWILIPKYERKNISVFASDHITLPRTIKSVEMMPQRPDS